jgi:spore coat polysaccharide biosynthesis protein SpsF (cytidylyltransferase family)
MKVAVVTQARVESTRLPAKVLKPIADRTLLDIHLENAKKSKLAIHFIVATTDESNAYLIEEKALSQGWSCYKGSTNDVLARFYFACESVKPDYIVRITSDCPLVQPDIIDLLINYALNNQLDYASTSENFPDGVDVEIFTWEMLEIAYKTAILLSEREHVTPWIRNNASKKGILEPKTDEFKDVRLTVDEIEDFNCIKMLIERFGIDKNWKEYAKFVIENPKLFNNQGIQRNEGFSKSLLNDKELNNG